MFLWCIQGCGVLASAMLFFGLIFATFWTICGVEFAYSYKASFSILSEPSSWSLSFVRTATLLKAAMLSLVTEFRSSKSFVTNFISELWGVYFLLKHHVFLTLEPSDHLQTNYLHLCITLCTPYTRLFTPMYNLRADFTTSLHWKSLPVFSVGKESWPLFRIIPYFRISWHRKLD